MLTEITGSLNYNNNIEINDGYWLEEPDDIGRVSCLEEFE